MRTPRRTDVSCLQCNEEKPCSNCVRHGVACSLAGGPNVPRDDVKSRQNSYTPGSSSMSSRTGSQPDTERTPGPEYRGSSPLRHLTKSFERTRPEVQDKEWITDLELMHHFDTHSLDILTEPAIAQSWHTDLPKLAFSTGYVMHIVLACSALHLAHLKPQRARALQVSAVSHMDQALQLYRQDESEPSAENADARFCFSWLVCMFAYATPSPVTAVDAICEVFRLVQGIDATVKDCFPWLVAGPFAPLLNQSLHETLRLSADSGYAASFSTRHLFADVHGSVIIPQGMAFGLDHLDYMMTLPSISADDSATCSMMLEELKQLYTNVVAASRSTGIALVICWPKTDPSAFISLLKARQPQALIILAHYCVVLDLLNDRWCLRGWSSRLMQHIATILEDPWKQWIAWPLQIVMMKNSPSLSMTGLLSNSSTPIF